MWVGTQGFGKAPLLPYISYWILNWRKKKMIVGKNLNSYISREKSDIFKLRKSITSECLMDWADTSGYFEKHLVSSKAWLSYLSI